MTLNETEQHGFNTASLCRTAIMTALVFAATFAIHIPIPLGYAHLGDAVIFIFILICPQKEALFSACIGSAFADLLSGFPVWIIPTLLIKFFMAEALYICTKKGKTTVKIIIGMTLGSLVMAAGYTVFGAALFDSIEAGLASTPGLLLEGLVNSVIAFVVYRVRPKNIAE